MKDKKEQFMDMMEFRHACKLFDDTKKIADEDLRYIITAGQKSPSSFGMEPWKFLIVINDALKTKLRPLCWDQPQITSCSHLIIILAAIENVKPGSSVPRQRFARRDLSDEQIDAYIQRYDSHLQETFSSDENIFAWTARQTYIAAANMMNAAACIGIDSCPIEGFQREDLEKILSIDTTEYRVSMLLPFGYRVNEQPKKVRLPLDEIVKFLD